jgi:hypothetical protein
MVGVLPAEQMEEMIERIFLILQRNANQFFFDAIA